MTKMNSDNMRQILLTEGEADVVSRFEAAVESLGLDHRRLTLKKYPDGIHWHIRKPGSTGTLEATYVPNGRRLWLDTRPGREAPWQAEQIELLKYALAARAHIEKREPPGGPR